MYKHTSRMITASEIFIVSKKSRIKGGIGKTIIATIVTSPIASTISLFANNFENLPKSMLYHYSLIILLPFTKPFCFPFILIRGTYSIYALAILLLMNPYYIFFARSHLFRLGVLGSRESPTYFLLFTSYPYYRHKPTPPPPRQTCLMVLYHQLELICIGPAPAVCFQLSEHYCFARLLLS